jgi:putative oxidoreductase
MDALEKFAQTTALMKYLIHTVRILLGLVFAFFGSNAFFHFLPMPAMQGEAGAFIGALMHSGYLYPIAALQVLGGLCLLSNRFVPLGLTLLGPVIVNIDLYHLFLDRSGLPMALIVSLFSLFLLWIYRYRFPAIFRP